jgi:predicted TIM-barrel fold metal-dependent hydrolase
MNLHNNLRKIGQAQSLETQRDEILVKLQEAERKWKNVKLELQHEQENRSGEAAAWTRTVSEKSRLCEDLQTQVRELQNELASVRRKNAINLKVSRAFFRRYFPICYFIG